MNRPLGAALALLLTAQAPPRAEIGDLAWLSGRWQSDFGPRWTEEVWSPPRAGAMIGYSRSGEGDRPGQFEFIRIAAGEDGALLYLAQPGGGPPVGFRLAEATERSATFENPAHDFPQRISYAREGDTMVATISAMDGSNAMRWTYRRQ